MADDIAREAKQVSLLPAGRMKEDAKILQRGFVTGIKTFIRNILAHKYSQLIQLSFELSRWNHSPLYNHFISFISSMTCLLHIGSRCAREIQPLWKDFEDGEIENQY